MKKGHIRSGFTLIELMIVVAIIGILASVAVPMLLQYIQDSKKAEAFDNLRLLADGAVAYFSEEHPSADGLEVVTQEFPEGGYCTAGADMTGNKVTPTSTNWHLPVWKNLRFDIARPHYFKYCYEAGSSGQTFAAIADAALEGDGALDTRVCIQGWASSGDSSMQVTAPLDLDPSIDCSP